LRVVQPVHRCAFFLSDPGSGMRHSDPLLTMRVYTDERQLGIACEIRKLSDLRVGPMASGVARAALVDHDTAS